MSIFCKLSVSVHQKPPEHHVHSYESSLQQLSTVTLRQPQRTKDELNTAKNQHNLLVLSAAKTEACTNMWSCCLWYLCLNFWTSLVSFRVSLLYLHLHALSIRVSDYMIEAAYCWILSTVCEQRRTSRHNFSEVHEIDSRPGLWMLSSRPFQ